MGYVLLGIGLVLVIEGLAIALAPSRLEEVLDYLRQIPVDTRRMLGLGAIGLGVVLVWIARSMGV